MQQYRRRILLTISLLLLLFWGVAGVIWAGRPSQAGQSDKLPASADAVLDPNNPTTNYGATQLEVTYSNFPSFAATRRSLLQFDLATTTAALDNAALVVTVVESNLAAGGQLTVTLYATGDGWTESTVTWENQPALGALLQTVTVAAGFLGEVEFNNTAVRNYLAAERDGDVKAALVLALTGGSGELGFGGNLLCESREGAHDGVNGNEPFIALPTPGTVTATATATEVAVTTPTPSVTATTVETPAVTATATMTVTMTATVTPATITPTRSETPTATATPTVSATPTISPTAVATGVATPGLYLPLINK